MLWRGQEHAGSRSDGKNHRSGFFCTKRTQLPWEEATEPGCTEALTHEEGGKITHSAPGGWIPGEMGFLPSLGDGSNTTKN